MWQLFLEREGSRENLLAWIRRDDGIPWPVARELCRHFGSVEEAAKTGSNNIVCLDRSTYVVNIRNRKSISRLTHDLSRRPTSPQVPLMLQPSVGEAIFDLVLGVCAITTGKLGFGNGLRASKSFGF